MPPFHLCTVSAYDRLQQKPKNRGTSRSHETTVLSPGLACRRGHGAAGGASLRPPAIWTMPCALAAERPALLPRECAGPSGAGGVPVHVQMATFHQESRLVGDARPPFRYTLEVIPMGRLSSALGYKPGAGRHLGRNTAPRPATASARRNDIDDAADFMGWYIGADAGTQRRSR